jgi:hypothetical protein
MENGSNAVHDRQALKMKTEFIFYLPGSHSAMAS